MRARCVAVAACIPALVFGQKAMELGPAPISGGSYTGRVSSIACDPTNADVVFAGTADGGVWKTVNGGNSWTPLTDFMPTTAIGAVAIDPQNSQIVYVGTGEANFANHSRYGVGIYKSLNGGATWSIYGDSTFGGRCISRIQIDPSNSQTIYAGVTAAGGFPERAAAKGHPGATGPLGVFRSTNGGESWSQLTVGLPSQACTDLALDPGNPNVLYAAIGRIFGATENGIYKSTNGGASWTKLAGGLPTTTLGRISLAMAPSDTNRVYALIANSCTSSGGGATTKGAYRSNDAGATWTSIPVGSFQSSNGWYYNCATVHPTNPDIVLMGGLDNRRTINGGTSWSTVTAGHVDNHAFAWDVSGRVWNGNDGGIYVSGNNGTNWTVKNGNIGAIQFYAGLSTHPSDPLFIVGGTQDNGTNRRNTSTKVWSEILGGDGGWSQIDRTNPQRVFACYQGTGNIFRSTTGGSGMVQISTGIAVSDRAAFFAPFAIDPSNPQRMLYATHRIYESVNGGTNWTPISGDVTSGAGAIRSIAIAPSDPLFVYVATNDGRICVSQDGGVSFVVRITNHPGWPRITREITIDPTNARTVYLAVAAFGTDQVLRSTDAGQTWQSLDGNMPDVPVNVVQIDTLTGFLYAGTDNGLFCSTNGGTTWKRFGNGLPFAAVIDLFVEPSKARVFVATQGRGAWIVRVPVPRD